MVAALLEAGAEVNTVDYDGWSPLHVACYYGQAEIADMILRHGGQVRTGGVKPQYLDTLIAYLPGVGHAVGLLT